MWSDTVEPGNATRPVSISKSTHPKAQMSARLSTLCPRACSGLMYAAVPSSTPSRVPLITIVGDCERSGAEPALDFASPKSSTLTVPPGVTLMLAGFRSR